MDGGGVVTVEGFGIDSTQVSDSKLKDFGSGFLKQERSDQTEEHRRAAKFLKVEGDFCVSKSTPLHHGTPVARSERILSFSSLKPEMTFFSKGDAAGYGLLSGSRGPFTPSQWIELEHQALIYKYLLANVPVPSNLLIPLKRSFNLHCLSSSATGLHPNSLGWGSFHLGFAGHTDPDLGRCRRTDGKKWRCSKEAVADQKYCEKHMNRGRHRSRKPVEGQNGHAAASSDLTNAKMVPLSSSTSASVISNGGGGLNFLSLEHTQFNNPTNSSADVLTNRIQDPSAFTPFEESIQMEFGLPPQIDSYTSSKSHGSFLNFADTKEDQSNYSIVFDPKPDWTQLSMSIPVTSSDNVGSGQKRDWAASMGGPLGEVLTNTSMGSSPTGVLQKGYFCSGSNSSSGSSPVAQTRTTHDNLNVYDDSDLLCP